MPKNLSRRNFSKGAVAVAALSQGATFLTAQKAQSESSATSQSLAQQKPSGADQVSAANRPVAKPNVLFLMTDQQRFDTIAALGNAHIYTPNLDRLVRRGIAFTQAYSTCPVCVAARYTIRTGCEPPTTRIFSNGHSRPASGQAQTLPERCGPYLAQVMRRMGYRTFGIGKFHSQPWDEDLGFDVHLHSEELYGTPDQRRRDDYAAWIAKEHPQFDYVENLMGERTEMYYIPQLSPQPAELTVERWAADRAVEQISAPDARPYFGFVSFVGPHPPLAPPIPFNRLYDPDRMPNPVRGDLANDHADEEIPWMNHAIWAEDINDPHARVLKARYYGEITYIDDCIGRILAAVEARSDARNTLICFFTDHGDHLGDHHAWQKESFFEASCHIPFLMSWPARLPAGARRDELACLADLFGIATSAAGVSSAAIPQLREGCDLLGVMEGKANPRQRLAAYYGEPGTPFFKIMVRKGPWKYIYLANGAREQLFHLGDDPNELKNLAESHRDTAADLRKDAVAACRAPGASDALAGASGSGDDLRGFPFAARKFQRIYQFDASRGVRGFPARPQDALEAYMRRSLRQ
ncbi:MAG: sulfatase-like hydrolase/transferase [Candidatus Sumerlaeota bacterium]|nr:sulfatase-like hydrolase/transferase [Candidatus Sumerlaeota bacterium]